MSPELQSTQTAAMPCDPDNALVSLFQTLFFAHSPLILHKTAFVHARFLISSLQ